MENHNEEIGEIYFGEVNQTTIGYVLKYLEKGRAARNRPGRNPEFSVMSKGIGENYLSENIKQYHLTNPSEKCFLSSPTGGKIAMPRYYKEKLFNEAQKESIALKMKELSNSKIELTEKARVELVQHTNEKLTRNARRRADH